VADPGPELRVEQDEIARESGLSSPHRLFALADGVFAISMTLLALDVRIPEDVPETVEAFNAAAGELYVNFGIFVLAFVITGRFWLRSHRMMADLHTVDGGVLERSISFLAGICSLPVATAVLFRFGSVPQAVAFASLLLAATSLLSGRLWWYLTRPDRKLSSTDPAARLPGLLAALWSTGVFLLAIPIAYLIAGVAGHEQVAYSTLVWLLLLFDGVFTRVVLRLLRRT
jgi:uncharacterized membrane protein